MACIDKPFAACFNAETRKTALGKAERAVERFLTISTNIGFSLVSGAKILDFGCGGGHHVHVLLAHGYDAWGYDILPRQESIGRKERLAFYDKNRRGGNRAIDWNTFCLPYTDNSFDAICSFQVLEHVMRHDLVFREFGRVMKEGAVSINIFPPRNKPWEEHIKVPFGHLVHHMTYYYIMAKLGYRKNAHLSPRATAERNYRYIRDYVNYLPNKELRRIASQYFNYVRIDPTAHVLGAKLSPVRHWLRSHFGRSICLVMADKAIAGRRAS